MSENYRLYPTKFIAAQRFPCDKEGKAILPRVIERAPRPGDVHPLQKRHITAFLRGMPIDYLYGLKRVELRPRESNKIGDPFGCYLIDEKAIILYSVPSVEWRFLGVGEQWLFKLHGAEQANETGCLLVRWHRPVDIAYYMYRHVFLHELGHHYVNQYRHKRKWPETVSLNETLADRHAFKLAKRNAFSWWHAFQPSDDATVPEEAG